MLCCHSLTTRSAHQAELGDILIAMFTARKSIFVDLLKWDVPVIAGRFEIDQFDDEHARYLVLTDGEGRHKASARLLPTLRPHILDSLYPQLCRREIPRSPATYEITRFCLDRGLDRTARREARDALVTMLADHAVANGITAYTAVAELGWSEKVRTFGWRCTSLGDVCLIEGRSLAALRIDIDAATPQALIDAGIGRSAGEAAARCSLLAPTESGVN